MKVRILFFSLILLVIALLLAACGATNPSPTLPPPPTPVTSDQPPAIVLELGTVSADVRETAVSESSPTPIETPTLAPTVTPTELPEPVIDPAQMPAISHDLLFVGNGKLKRWQRDGQVVTLLDGDVVDYSLSADGRRAVVSQLLASTKISNTATAVTQTVNTYAMNYVNLETGDTQLLIPAINSFIKPSFEISQDGRHLAVSSGLGFGDPESLTLGEKTPTELYAMEIGTAQPPKKVHDCGDYCYEIVWHQDNNFFVFGSDDGLFMYNLSAKEPELLIRSEPGSAYNEAYSPLSWAKNGRWLMVQNGGSVEGWDTAIFDVPTKQLMPIPNTFVSAGPYQPELTWMTDDRIFLTRLQGRPAGPVLGETYRVDQDAGEVQLDESVILTEALMQPLAPMHWENGRFGYALFEPNHPENGLYQRIAFNEPAERFNDLPVPAFLPGKIVWAPDGSGAVMQEDEGIYYAPVDGELVDLETAVGLTGDNFTWLP